MSENPQSYIDMYTHNPDNAESITIDQENIDFTMPNLEDPHSNIYKVPYISADVFGNFDYEVSEDDMSEDDINVENEVAGSAENNNITNINTSETNNTPKKKELSQPISSSITTTSKEEKIKTPPIENNLSSSKEPTSETSANNILEPHSSKEQTSETSANNILEPPSSKEPTSETSKSLENNLSLKEESASSDPAQMNQIKTE